MPATFPEYQHYFYNDAHWNVEEAYKAYEPAMQTVYDLDFLEDYTGRIWFINSNNYVLADEAMEKYDNMKIIDQKAFSTAYKQYQYTFTIIEKGE